MEGRPLLANLSKFNAKTNKFSNKANDSNAGQLNNNLNNDNVPNASLSSLGAGSLTPIGEGGGIPAILSTSPGSGGGVIGDAQTNQATKSSNQANPTSTSVNNVNTNDNNDTLNRKEKKRSTILPWTKGNS